MDTNTITTTTNNNNNYTATHSLDTENKTPPANKSLSFTNGALKKHSPYHTQPLAVVGVYRECLKNHAASLGGHAVDGCGEFMPSPAATHSDPTSLKCAACGCHRNFHRRDDDPSTAALFLDFRRPRPPPPPRRGSTPLSSPSPPPPPQPSHYHQNAVATPATPTAVKAENPSGRKRFRTKFSQDQKEKMHSFSEKLGWKMQRSEEGLIEEFCSEIGVGKGVLKVWMHNNKHTFGKRDIHSTTTTTNINHHHHHQIHHHEGSNGVHLHVSADGSPSSA